MSKRVFTQTFCVAGAILEHDGRILLVKEATEKITDKGKWYHPASWIMNDEDPIAAAVRTVKRETGYDFKPENLLGVYSLVRRDQEAKIGVPPHALKLIFTGSILDENPSAINPDISDNRWFTPEEIRAMDTSVLRGIDVKDMVNDYFSGKGTSLAIVTHTVQC